MGTQALNCGLDKLGIQFAGGEIVDTAVNNPTTFLAQPGLFLGEFKDDIEDLGPFGEGGRGLEEDRGLDECFRTEETAKVVIALFLYNRISQISTIVLVISCKALVVEHTCPVSLPEELDCDSQIFSASAIPISADSLGTEKI